MRRATRGLGALGLALLVGPGSEALGDELPTRRATSGARLMPVLPTLRVSGSSDGEGTIAAGLDWVFGASERWDLALSPTFEAASSDGLSRVLALSPGGASAPTSWKLGASLTAIARAPATWPGLERKRRRLLDGARRKAHALCVKRCAGTALGDDDRTFCGAPRDQDPRTLDRADFCKTGQDLLDDRLEALDAQLREAVAQYPAHVLSVGGLAGQESFDFLDGGDASAPDKLLPRASRTEVPFTVAASYAGVRTSGFTVEAAALYDRRFAASDMSARWCTPVGRVGRDGGASDPAMQCQDAALGAPRPDGRLFATLQLGYIDLRPPRGSDGSDGSDGSSGSSGSGGARADDATLAPRTLWRASIGPAVRYRELDDSWRIGIEAPLYLNFASTDGEDSGAYKGLLRVAPSLSLVRGPSGTSPQFLVTVELLGQRTLFARALDWR